MNKIVKIILSFVMIISFLYWFIPTNSKIWSSDSVQQKAEKKSNFNKNDKSDSDCSYNEYTIKDQEIHIDGFPVIYIEGNNEIDKDNWKAFSTELQEYCNIPWLTKNVSSIHYCSLQIMENYNHHNARGFARRDNNSIYIKEINSDGYAETIIHEFGHVYDFTHQITANYDLSILENNQKKICKNGAIDNSHNCRSNYEETFAELIMLYVLYPEADYLPKEISNWIDTLPR